MAEWNKQPYRTTNLQDWVDVIENKVNRLKRQGYSVENAIEMVKLAMQLQDFDFKDEQFVGYHEELISVLSEIAQSLSKKNEE